MYITLHTDSGCFKMNGLEKIYIVNSGIYYLRMRNVLIIYT